MTYVPAAGELVGAKAVARELTREAVGEAFSLCMGSVELKAPLRAGWQPQAGTAMDLREKN